MPLSAYIMMNVEPVKTLAVMGRLKLVPGGIIHEVLGPYDLIVELEAPTPEYLAAKHGGKILLISGVTSTVTCTWIG